MRVGSGHDCSIGLKVKDYRSTVSFSFARGVYGDSGSSPASRGGRDVNIE
jgi:hypothetical protein